MTLFWPPTHQTSLLGKLDGVAPLVGADPPNGTPPLGKILSLTINNLTLP